MVLHKYVYIHKKKNVERLKHITKKTYFRGGKRSWKRLLGPESEVLGQTQNVGDPRRTFGVCLRERGKDNEESRTQIRREFCEGERRSILSSYCVCLQHFRL